MFKDTQGLLYIAAMAMAIMDDHGAMEFESKLESAIETVARVLHTTRHPK